MFKKINRPDCDIEECINKLNMIVWFIKRKNNQDEKIKDFNTVILILKNMQLGKKISENDYSILDKLSKTVPMLEKFLVENKKSHGYILNFK